MGGVGRPLLSSQLPTISLVPAVPPVFWLDTKEEDIFMYDLVGGFGPHGCFKEVFLNLMREGLSYIQDLVH